MRNLIWLASYPKSGNTWARMFVAAYLSGAESFDLKQVNQFSRSESLLSLFADVAEKPSAELTDEDLTTHRLAVQERLARNIGQRVVKTHNARLLRNGQRLIFSRFTKAGIYVVRNPLDVVDSLADHTNKTLDEAIELMNEPGHRLGKTEMHAAQSVGTWSHHVRTWLNNEHEFPLIVLRYEDLQDDPCEHFGRLIKFLEWDYDADRVRRAVDLTAFASLQQAEQAEGFAEASTVARSGRFFRHGESGRWRQVLTAKQAARVIVHHREAMAMLGYDVPNLARHPKFLKTSGVSGPGRDARSASKEAEGRRPAVEGDGEAGRLAPSAAGRRPAVEGNGEVGRPAPSAGRRPRS